MLVPPAITVLPELDETKLSITMESSPVVSALVLMTVPTEVAELSIRATLPGLPWPLFAAEWVQLRKIIQLGGRTRLTIYPSTTVLESCVLHNEIKDVADVYSNIAAVKRRILDKILLVVHVDAV